jgi:DNA-binding CsgD family transcriptional regulator
MNIYIFTENNYLYYGIYFSLGKKVKPERITTLKGYFPANSIILIDNDCFRDSKHLMNDYMKNKNTKIFITNKLLKEAVMMNGIIIANLMNIINTCNHILDNDFIKNITCGNEYTLTRRESIVIKHILHGNDLKGVSNLMNINAKTVYAHLSNIQNKMKCKSIHFVFHFRSALTYGIKMIKSDC